MNNTIPEVAVTKRQARFNHAVLLGIAEPFFSRGSISQSHPYHDDYLFSPLLLCDYGPFSSRPSIDAFNMPYLHGHTVLQEIFNHHNFLTNDTTQRQFLEFLFFKVFLKLVIREVRCGSRNKRAHVSMLVEEFKNAYIPSVNESMYCDIQSILVIVRQQHHYLITSDQLSSIIEQFISKRRRNVMFQRFLRWRSQQRLRPRAQMFTYDDECYYELFSSSLEIIRELLSGKGPVYNLRSRKILRMYTN